MGVGADTAMKGGVLGGRMMIVATFSGCLISGPVSSSSRRTHKKLNGIARTKLPARITDSAGVLDLRLTVKQLDVAGTMFMVLDDERRCSSIAPVLSFSKHDDFDSLGFR